MWVSPPGIWGHINANLDNDGTRIFDHSSNMLKDRPDEDLEELEHAQELIPPRHARYSDIQDLLKKIRG